MIKYYSGKESVITVLSADKTDALLKEKGYSLEVSYKDEMANLESMYK